MGGRIWCKPNDDGIGSSFTFTMAADAADAGKLPAKEAMPVEDHDFHGKHILLVEDVEINREIVSAFLEDTGIKMDCAENGVKACEMFAANPDGYDLIIMDIQMPEMDGLSATRRIRAMEHSRRTPILAMSANAFKEDVDASLEAGMDGHISKPVNRDMLLRKMGEMMARRNGI